MADDPDGDERGGSDGHRTIPLLRASIREQIDPDPMDAARGGGDKGVTRATRDRRQLRREEVAAIYERLAGKRLPSDATVPEARYRVIDVLGGIENRSQFASSYPFRRDELEAIDDALRETEPWPPDGDADADADGGGDASVMDTTGEPPGNHTDDPDATSNGGE